jgi:hypothetical protein
MILEYGEKPGPSPMGEKKTIPKKRKKNWKVVNIKSGTITRYLNPV